MQVYVTMKVKVGSEKGKKGVRNKEWEMGNGEWGMGSRNASFLSPLPTPYSLLRNFLMLFWQSGVCRAMTFKSTPARIACSKLIESIW